MLDHTKKKKSVVKDRKEWDKIIVNIPKELLKEFDIASQTRYYSRSEAIKEAMRTFIKTDKNPNWRYVCCNCIAKELEDD